MKVNEGEVPQYYVKESHEAIIPTEEWDRVQREIVRRKSLGRSYSGNSIFSTRVVCGDCGAFFGSKVWNSTSKKYRRTIWQCNNKFKGDKKCKTPHVLEETIKEKFIEAFNILFEDKNEIIANCELVAALLTDCSEIDTQKETLKQELEVIEELTRKCVQENATQPQNQDEYTERYNGYVTRCEDIISKINTLETERTLKQERSASFEDFINTFRNHEGNLLEFDEKLWIITIDVVKIMPNKEIIFKFKNGSEIKVA